MTNKEFDQWLRESLSAVNPEHSSGDWEHFVQRVEESESELDSGFDDAIRTSVSDIGSTAVPDWSRMERRLEADETVFDDNIRQSIENLEVPYNASTWPTLNEKLTTEEQLRRRLISVKILELAVILILFFTFYNFFPTLESKIIRPAEDLIRKELLGKETAMLPTAPEEISTLENLLPAVVEAISSSDVTPLTSERSSSTSGSEPAIDRFAGRTDIRAIERVPAVVLSGTVESQVKDQVSAPVSSSADFSLPLASTRISGMPHSVPTAVTTASSAFNTGLLGSILPEPSKKSKLRFGMMAAIDVNTLFFPEEHFYSQGRSINFSEKEIVADGYSAGATMLFDFSKFMIETGLTYSSKDFGPDRNLFIGTSLDRHSLDFEKITLDIVSLPLYMHWKIDGKGSWRIYATGGAAMHVIANANYDLIAENYYTSSIVQNPQQLQNEREVQRVREHMLDGAKFSTKGYLTAAGGLGVERYLNPRLSIYLQPMYEYQIPFFGLIDQNGKHLQSGSLLLGTRISL